MFHIISLKYNWDYKMLIGASLLIATFLPALYASNWCESAKSCGLWKHLDCSNPDSEIPASCTNAVLVDIQSIQPNIVRKHNEVRNRVAGGTLPSSRMGTMRWNAHLVEASLKVVRNCNATHRECMYTPNFHWTGQNTASLTYAKAANRNSLNVVLEIIDQWIALQSKTTVNDIKAHGWPMTVESSATKDRAYEKFSQMVRGYATRIGCSAIRHDKGNNYVLILSCMYDAGLPWGRAVYDIGPTATKCQTGKNPNFPNLCSFNEIYNVNKYWEDYPVEHDPNAPAPPA